ncbi:MAG: hypothetical protein PHD21_06010 [Flavobacteriales bacterium]|nr:hypothetical protein [Flavobacteriales bacterium]
MLFWHLTSRNNILFFCLLASQSTFAHKYYVSTTQVNIHQDTLQISVSVFVDDFENALAILYGVYPNICTDDINKKHEADSLVFRYFKDHFFIKSNGSIIPYEKVNIHCTEDTFSTEFIAVIPKKSNDFTLINTVLMSLFAEQRNIIQVISPSSKRCILLSKGHESQTFALD